MPAKVVQRVNVTTSELELQHFPNLPDGFRPDIARVGKLLGATRTGIIVHELRPARRSGRTTTRTRKRSGCS